MNPEPNEYELALRARDGDQEALAELVERTRLRLFSLAYAELRHYEDAQDAVAAALVQVRHQDSLAGTVLAQLGVELDRARQEVRAYQAEAVASG